LLDDFLLPLSNTLPCANEKMSLVMKDIEMEYQVMYACNNYRIIYYGQHTTNLHFPQCGISKYQTNQVIDEVPSRFFIIFPKFHISMDCLGAKTYYNLRIIIHGREVKMFFSQIPANGTTFRGIDEI
jgi:hypothetical protein